MSDATTQHPALALPGADFTPPEVPRDQWEALLTGVYDSCKKHSEDGSLIYGSWGALDPDNPTDSNTQPESCALGWYVLDRKPDTVFPEEVALDGRKVGELIAKEAFGITDNTVLDQRYAFFDVVEFLDDLVEGYDHHSPDDLDADDPPGAHFGAALRKTFDPREPWYMQ